MLSIFLIIIYRRIIHGIDFSEPFKKRYLELNRKHRIKNYIKRIRKSPADVQKMIFSESLILISILFIMFLLVSKAVFFAAVASNSMKPTFNKDDLILMQNIDHNYTKGDIIMFKRPDTSLPVSHRIVNIKDEEIKTAGDASGPDWWKIKKEDILGKAILIMDKPIVIKEYGKFFIAENKNQDFGPFKDYRNYFLFIEVVKTYGYIIAVICLILYIILTAKAVKLKR